MIDLNKLEQYRENNRIEAKRALGGLPHSIWETYSAFANTLGGILLLGVEEYEDKSLHTVNLPDPEGMAREFWALVNDPHKASVNILSRDDVAIQEVNGDRILVITIPRAERSDRPVYVEGDIVSGTYRRSEEGDCRCTEEERRAMLRDAAARTQDMRVLEAAEMSALNAESVRAYRRDMRRVRPGHVWETLDDGAFLEKLGAAGHGEDGALHPTGAGLLMFGRAEEIRREYPRFHLDYRESGAVRRPVRIVSSRGTRCGNIYDFFRKLLRRWQRLELPAANGDLPAVRRALREALANCLVNADYYGRGGVIIRCDENKIILANPGVFRIRLHTARGGGVSDPRNSAVHKMLRLIDVGEGAGNGIPDIMRVWREQGWEEPYFTQSFDPDRTVLPLRFGTGGAGDRTAKQAGRRLGVEQEAMIIDFLTDNVSAGAAEVAGILGVSMPQAREMLQRLIDEDIVVSDVIRRRRVYRLKA